MFISCSCSRLVFSNTLTDRQVEAITVVVMEETAWCFHQSDSVYECVCVETEVFIIKHSPQKFGFIFIFLSSIFLNWPQLFLIDVGLTVCISWTGFVSRIERDVWIWLLKVVHFSFDLCSVFVFVFSSVITLPLLFFKNMYLLCQWTPQKWDTFLLLLASGIFYFSSFCCCVLILQFCLLPDEAAVLHCAVSPVCMALVQARAELGTMVYLEEE